MAYKRRIELCRENYRKFENNPTIYEKVGFTFKRSKKYPKTNLTPEDFEIDNMISAGVKTDSAVKYEKPNDLSQIDSVLAKVSETIDEIETQKSE